MLPNFSAPPLPPFGYTLIGTFANEETASILGLDVTYTTTAGPDSLAGNYPIVPGGTYADHNYQISFANGTLTVGGTSSVLNQQFSNFDAANDCSNYSQVTLTNQPSHGSGKWRETYQGQDQAPPGCIAFGSSFGPENGRR